MKGGDVLRVQLHCHSTTHSFSPLPLLSSLLSGAKVKTKHLGYWKKVKGFGECAKQHTFYQQSRGGEAGTPNTTVQVITRAD